MHAWGTISFFQSSDASHSLYICMKNTNAHMVTLAKNKEMMEGGELAAGRGLQGATPICV